MNKYPPIYNKLRSLTGKAIVDYQMIKNGDHLLVGLSGGKDSMLLMHLLTDLKKRAPVKFKITAGIVDGNFDAFKSQDLAEYCRKQQWDHRFIEVNLKKHIDKKNKKGLPCSFCSRLRRGKLYYLADELGCSKIALGHNLDDICESFLIGLFRGQGISTMGPNVLGDKNKKRIIRPLAYIPEKMLVDTAFQMKLKDFGKCDFIDLMNREGDRAKMKKALDVLQGDFYDISNHMLKALQNVSPEFLLDKRFII